MTISNVGVGAAFGVALSVSGVWYPSVVLGQMQLRNYHMLQAFVAASACSTILISLAARWQWADSNIRKDASFGWLFKFDGNVIGGVLVGGGMALSGACPGTVIVQVANGLRSGYFAALGCILGGFIFVTLIPKPGQGTSPDHIKNYTIQSKFQIKSRDLLLLFEASCLFVLVVSSLGRTDANYWLSPVLGGAFIGLAQALSLLVRRKTIGVSTAWEDLGRFMRSFIWSTPKKLDILGAPSIIFLIGIYLGSVAAASFLTGATSTPIDVPDVEAFVGGIFLALGSRMAGGCTSGHGISGMATFSISSFISVGAMFGGGIAVAALR